MFLNLLLSVFRLVVCLGEDSRFECMVSRCFVLLGVRLSMWISFW